MSTTSRPHRLFLSVPAGAGYAVLARWLVALLPERGGPGRYRAIGRYRLQQFPSDVTAGAMIGIGMGTLTAWLLELPKLL